MKLYNKTTMRYIITTLFLLLIIGCGASRLVETESSSLLEPELASLPFKTIGQHYSCGWVDHAGIVVRDQQKLEWMWERFYKFSLHPPPLPKIDYGRVMWICIFRGQYSTWGYTTAIQRIYKASDAHSTFLRVQVKEGNPNWWMYVKQEFSQPFHIVELERSELPVRFTYKESPRWR